MPWRLYVAIGNGILLIITFAIPLSWGNPALLGTFSMATILSVVIGLAFTPALVRKCRGMYRLNLYGSGAWLK